jgi:ATP-binding cassette, subfamily A (ABC1), member 3
VESISESKLAVKADHIRKTYDKNVAVKDVCFALEFGDCFALLGINGAGKTTTFKCLTNDIVPTKGIPFIVGHDVRKEFSEARKHIGYCPQFDAIFGLLTVREHLEFYSKIKKIPKEYVPNLIKAQLKSMNLEQYENKRSGTLSGGNKRKLSVAMAMLGNPPVVFLDEPSAGMDPKARRFMWEIIAKISTRGKNSAVILTTHSMEEAEALSTSMGIMVNGQFKCFGSKQHIKNKFGFGYQVEIKFRTLKNDQVDQIIEEKRIHEFLRSKYAACYKVENTKGEEIVLVNHEACLAVLGQIFRNDHAIQEMNKEGFGREILERLETFKFFPLKSLVKWEYVLRNNWAALDALVKEFGSAKLLEQYSPRFRYRVPKGNKSVGYFFSFMETLQSKLDIDEYSASQTTLEQIFNGFARQGERVVLQREFTPENMTSSVVTPGGIVGEISYESGPEDKRKDNIKSLNINASKRQENSVSHLNKESKSDDIEEIDDEEEE